MSVGDDVRKAVSTVVLITIVINIVFCTAVS